MTETSNSSTLPSAQPAGADHLIEVISTFSNNLFGAIKQHTFQIEMMRDIMSAILQRMEDCDSARQPTLAQSVFFRERQLTLFRCLSEAS